MLIASIPSHPPTMSPFPYLTHPAYAPMHARCRYAYRSQPDATMWNCMMLAQALYTADLVDQESAQEALDNFGEVIKEGGGRRGEMGERFGLGGPRKLWGGGKGREGWGKRDRESRFLCGVTRSVPLPLLFSGDGGLLQPAHGGQDGPRDLRQDHRAGADEKHVPGA